MTSRGIRNNNPGNVRLSRDHWQGQVWPGADKSFCTFDTMSNGVRCAGLIFLNYQKAGLNSTRQMIHRWAPPVENNTDAYVNDVAHSVGLGADAPVHFTTPLLVNFLRAVFRHENGPGDIVSTADLTVGVMAALKG